MQGPNAVLNVITVPPGAGLGQRIVIDGERGAIFQYNSSNQLVTSWASSAGVDPYGNAYPAGLDISSAGLVLEGDFYIIDASGAFFYSAAPAAGDLIASIASVAGTDAEGNPYVAGVTAYVDVTTGFPGTYAIELGNQTQVWGTAVAALVFTNLTNPPFQAPAVTAQGSPAGTAANLQSGRSTALAFGSTLAALDSVNGGMIGGLCVAEAGAFQVFASDGNNYDTERLTFYNTGTVPITSTTPITIYTMTVGVGTYRLSGILSCTNGASGTLQGQTMRIGGTATLSSIRLQVRSAQEGSTSSTAAYGQITSTGADPSGVRTPALSEIFSIEFDGIFVVSAAGTVLVQGRNVTSSSDVSYTVNQFSFADLMPVTLNGD
jgi:hypothetical protein